jgi:hypothetical protein
MDYIEFPVPKGFTPPEGVKEGDTFDFMASGYFKGPNMYLTAVEGTAVAAAEEAEEEGEEEGEGEEMGMVDAVERGMAEEA